MGAYLSTPVTEKETASGNIGGIGWGVASMQGWRRSHEDAHAVVSLGKSTAMFGVFDGHCGREVSSRQPVVNFIRRQKAPRTPAAPRRSLDSPRVGSAP